MNNLQALAESIASGLNKDYDFAFIERVKFSIKTLRALLIKQDTERSIVEKSIIQGVCVDLVRVDMSECCNVDTGCTILRTATTIPKPIRLKQKSPFLFVGTLNNKSFNFSSKEDWDIDSHRKYANNLIQYDYFNNYIYINNADKLKYSFIKGIFEDPEEVPNCSSSQTDIVCYDENNYPMSMEMTARISDILIKGEYRILNLDENDQILTEK